MHNICYIEYKPRQNTKDIKYCALRCPNIIFYKYSIKSVALFHYIYYVCDLFMNIW